MRCVPWGVDALSGKVARYTGLLHTSYRLRARMPPPCFFERLTHPRSGLLVVFLSVIPLGCGRKWGTRLPNHTEPAIPGSLNYPESGRFIKLFGDAQVGTVLRTF
jgi:hypothetical protein